MHKQKEKQTKRVWVFAEDAMNRTPWFAYNNLFFYGKSWLSTSSGGKPVEVFQTFSNKVALGLSVIYDDDYSKRLSERVVSNSLSYRSIPTGVYSDRSINTAYNINTNSMILSSLLYKMRNRTAMLPISIIRHNESKDLVAGFSSFFVEACNVDECNGDYFFDPLNDLNEALFERSHHWSNGFPFTNRWEKGAINFSGDGMKIELSDDPKKNEKYTYRSGELRSRHFYGYGCFSIEMKPISSPGIITSFFLFSGRHDKYEGSNAQHNEIDIEFVGKHTESVQFNFWTNDNDYSSNNAVLIPLGFDASKAFHEYAMLCDGRKIVFNGLWMVKCVMRYCNQKVTLFQP